MDSDLKAAKSRDENRIERFRYELVGISGECSELRPQENDQDTNSFKEVRRKKMLRSISTRLLLMTAFCMAVILSGAGSALAQSAVTGAIGGTVTDPSNAAIPSATVTLRSQGTNKEETVVTGEDGRFRFTNLQPGTYSVSVSASGFADYKQSEITVEVGRLTDVNAALRVGAAAATVEIIADAQVVNTESKEFASNINQTAINELPINGRRWSNFALLTPGSAADGNFGLISFRGISGLLNNNTVDGGDNNQAFFSEERGRTRISYSISQSSIREFQVNTSNYSAEYGRAAGGVVNAVTKSGTNEFHGDAFYYQRNNELGSTEPAGVPVDSFWRNGDNGRYQTGRRAPSIRRNDRWTDHQGPALLFLQL